MLLVGLLSLVLSLASIAIHILELYFFFIILQENIDTVKIEKVENVGEEDCIKTEEEFYIQLVRTVKSEEEVSFVCWCILW